MRGQPTISPIYRHGQQADTRDPLEAWGKLESMRRKAWRDHGTIAVRPAELPHGLRAALEEWANDQYGARNGKS